jgi:hypothetical protein
MKVKNTFRDLIFVFAIIQISIIAKSQGTTHTPMGQTVYLENDWDTPANLAAWEADAANWITANNWDAVRIAPATSNYNCHSYAWSVVEGGPSIDAWMNQKKDGNSNLSKYWSNDAYISTTTISNHEKIFYSSGDHSATTTAAAGKVRSKWGAWPCYEHSTAQCPYNSGNLQYYKLVNPTISSSSEALCNYSQRTLSESSFTNISLNYDWSTSNPLTQVSGDGTSSYIVASTSQNGAGVVGLTITTPSGASSTVTKTVWVGPPTAPLDIFGIQNGWEFWSETNYDFTVNSAYVQNASQYNWVVRGGSIVAGQGTPTITYKTAKVAPGAQKTFDVSVKVGNTCGWGPYLMRSGYVNPPPGSSMFIVYPNPATTEVTVSVEADVSAKMATGSATENVEIKALDFYDMYGNRLKAEIYGKGQQSARVNVSGFQKGTYWVIVNKGGAQEEKHTLVVE